MSIEKSLKTKGKLVRPRNVYTRTERIKMLKAEGKWDPTMSIFGIPKVKTLKLKRKAKSEKKAEKAAVAEAAPTAGATTAAGAPSSAAGKEKAKK